MKANNHSYDSSRRRKECWKDYRDRVLLTEDICPSSQGLTSISFLSLSLSWFVSFIPSLEHLS
jgi:hypothetical protein